MTDGPPEVVNNKCPSVDARRRLFRTLRNEIGGEFDFGRLMERHNLEVTVDVLWPAGSDKVGGLDDFLGGKWPEWVGFGFSHLDFFERGEQWAGFLDKGS